MVERRSDVHVGSAAKRRQKCITPSRNWRELNGVLLSTLHAVPFLPSELQWTAQQRSTRFLFRLSVGGEDIECMYITKAFYIG